MLVWIICIITILVFLASNLGVFNKTPQIINTKEASKWTARWVTISFLFYGWYSGYMATITLQIQID
jgi:tellurite resistance protein TerC